MFSKYSIRICRPSKNLLLDMEGCSIENTLSNRRNLRFFLIGLFRYIHTHHNPSQWISYIVFNRLQNCLFFPNYILSLFKSSNVCLWNVKVLSFRKGFSLLIGQLQICCTVAHYHIFFFSLRTTHMAIYPTSPCTF